MTATPRHHPSAVAHLRSGLPQADGYLCGCHEVLHRDERGETKREQINDALLDGVRDQIRSTGQALRENDLPRLGSWARRAPSAT